MYCHPHVLNSKEVCGIRLVTERECSIYTIPAGEIFNICGPNNLITPSGWDIFYPPTSQNIEFSCKEMRSPRPHSLTP